MGEEHNLRECIELVSTLIHDVDFMFTEAATYETQAHSIKYRPTGDTAMTLLHGALEMFRHYERNGIVDDPYLVAMMKKKLDIDPPSSLKNAKSSLSKAFDLCAALAHRPGPRAGILEGKKFCEKNGYSIGAVEIVVRAILSGREKLSLGIMEQEIREFALKEGRLPKAAVQYGAGHTSALEVPLNSLAAQSRVLKPRV